MGRNIYSKHMEACSRMTSQNAVPVSVIEKSCIHNPIIIFIYSRKIHLCLGQNNPSQEYVIESHSTLDPLYQG